MNLRLRHRLMRIAALPLLAAMLAACSLGGPLREDVKASKFSLSRVPKSWAEQSTGKEKDSNGADRVYRDRNSKAMIAVNSLCHRYESTSLERLAHQYETDLRDVETLSETELKLDGRRALRVHLKGLFDGVPSEVLVVVTRKNDCLFDFSLIGKSPLASTLVADFDEWVATFNYSVKQEQKKNSKDQEQE